MKAICAIRLASMPYWSRKKYNLSAKKILYHDIANDLCFTLISQAILSGINGRLFVMRNNHLAALFSKHADLDARLRSEASRPNPDFAVLNRLKKEKLRVKENIFSLK